MPKKRKHKKGKEKITEENNLVRFEERLKDIIDPDHGLLEKLRKRNALSREDAEKIKHNDTYIERNRMVLHCVNRDQKHDDFLLALTEADQAHVANYIHYNGDRNKDIESEWPLTETETMILDINEDSLIDIIDPDHGLLDKLLSEKVINGRQRQTISSKPTIHERNSSLLSFLRRRSISDYWKMIQCLSDTNQGHIAELLDEGGVALDVHADISVRGNVQNTSDIEEQISTKLSEMILAKIPDSSAEDTRRILSRVNFKVIAAKKGKSVVLYVYCKVVEDLNHVQDLITSGKINSVLNKIFVGCLSFLVSLDVKTRTINNTKLMTVRNFIKDFENQQKSSIEFLKPNLSKTKLMHLPLEVLDVILKKAYFSKAKHEDITHCVKRCIDLIGHFSSVEHCWFQRISSRRFKKSVWSFLSGFQRKNNYNLNLQFFEENIRLSNAIAKVKSMDCLSDVQVTVCRRKTFLRTKKNHANCQALEISLMLQVMSESMLDVFTKCLSSFGQNSIARVIQNGGVTSRIEIRSQRGQAGRNLDREFVKRLNEVKYTEQTGSSDRASLLKMLKDDDIEILTATEDREIVVWLWCKSANALKNLKKMYLSHRLFKILRRLMETTSQFVQQRSINIDYHGLDSDGVLYSAGKIAFANRLSFGEKTPFVGKVFGVTKLNDKIYTLCGNNAFPFCLMYAFEALNSFRLLVVFEIKEIEVSTDLGSSENENCLYVIEPWTSSNSCRIWRIKLQQDKYECSKWLELENDFRPITLSLTRDEQLLMVSQDPSASLKVYKSDAQPFLSTKLPEDINEPRHALKATNGNFVILHSRWMNVDPEETSENSVNERNEETENVNWMVSEVSRDGKTIVRSYSFRSKQERLVLYSTGGYLAMDSDDRVLVADIGNNRVILLNSDLKWDRILVPTQDEVDETKGKKVLLLPCRILFDKQNQQLIVAGDGYKEMEINVYSAYI